jgi:uncharacterized protein (DUF736 family)
MATIGKVTKQKDGSYTGHVKTLSMERDISISIVPIKGTPASDKHPNFKVMARDSEVGAAWNKKNQEGGAYVSVTLEAPEFGASKLYANLGKAPDGKDGEFNLIWNARR